MGWWVGGLECGFGGKKRWVGGCTRRRLALLSCGVEEGGNEGSWVCWVGDGEKGKIMGEDLTVRGGATNNIGIFL